MVLDTENKIAYIRFPAKESEVAEAREGGYKIIDAMFAPKELIDAEIRMSRSDTASVIVLRGRDDSEPKGGAAPSDNTPPTSGAAPENDGEPKNGAEITNAPKRKGRPPLNGSTHSPYSEIGMDNVR